MSKLSEIVITSQSNIYSKDDNYNLDIFIDQIKNDYPLNECQLKIICEKVISLKKINFNIIQYIFIQAKEIFKREANLLEVRAPVTICGDIRGHFFDLLELFKIGGDIPTTNYLFLGNYINFGYYSLECITLLLLLKVRYPNRIFLLRGNHENRQISQIHGFYDECLSKYGNANIWKYFTDVFDYLPLAAIVESKIFCVHSGLSPDIETLEQINKLDRIQETPPEGPLKDFLCSYPDDVLGWNQAYRPRINPPYKFGYGITEKFNRDNKLNMLIRGHELFNNGYSWYHKKQILTIFSAPNYTYRFGNKAAIIEFDEYLNNIILQFIPNPIQRRKDQNKDFNRRIPDYFI